MSHYDNAVCGAVAIKSVVLQNPLVGSLGLFVWVCAIAYPAVFGGVDPCPDGGELTEIRVSYDGGISSRIEEKCVIEEPSKQKVDELEQKYPDYKINVPGW